MCLNIWGEFWQIQNGKVKIFVTARQLAALRGLSTFLGALTYF